MTGTNPVQAAVKKMSYGRRRERLHRMHAVCTPSLACYNESTNASCKAADLQEARVARLTRERVVSLVGRSRLDDHAIAEIMRTGASELELLEAVNRVTRGSSDVGVEKMKPMTRTVAALCEILAIAGFDLGEPD